MPGTYEFDLKEPAGCDRAEELLTDALDAALSPADQAWFDRHTAHCATCSARLAETRRGAAWLEVLKTPRPEPSATLYDRILAATEERARPEAVEVPAGLAAEVRPAANVLAFQMPPARARSSHGLYLQPRLAMTAAMAFFSIALTLSLTGVRLDQLPWAALKAGLWNPAQLKPATLERSLFEAKAQAMRSYESLRVVHVLESRVDDLREASGLEQRRQPLAQPEERKSRPAEKKRGGGVSRMALPPAGQHEPRRASSLTAELRAAERKTHV